MNKLFLMVGNIGTGKSTTTTRLMDAAGDPKNTVILSADSLALLLFNNYYGPSIWEYKHVSMYMDIKKHIVRAALTRGFDVILDGTHMSKLNRKAYIDIAKKFGAEVIVYLHTYPDGLKRRIDNPKSNDESPWANIYNTFSNAYETPSIDEGINSIIEVKGCNNE